jgi:hypothetical protein
MKKLFLFFACLSFTLFSNAQGCFNNYSTYGVGLSPSVIETSDFNNDGKIDIVVANKSSNNISIFLATAPGVFATPINYNVSLSPRSICTADYNGDGYNDIAVGSYGGVTILLNDGFGTFLNFLNYSGYSNIRSMVCNDFNGDGNLDLGLVSPSSNVVSVLLGFGNGSFTAGVNYLAGTDPLSVKSGDVNNDGKLDLVILLYSSNQVSILLGTGNGTFGIPINNSLLGTAINDISLADYNADGKIDLSTANYGTNNISVYLGVGNGTFGLGMLFSSIAKPYSLISSDFNNDGKIDIALSTTNGSGMSVYVGNGLGSFSLQNTYIGNSCYSIVSSDFNNDGFTDISVVEDLGAFINGIVKIYINNSQILTDISSQTNVSCFGASNGSATINATGGNSFTYAWSPSGGTSPTATGLSAGTYNCLVTNNCGNTATQNVVITQPLASSITSGPGGVGDNMDTEMWFDASKLTLTNNTAVTTLTDRSGNARNATQSTANRKPLFLTNQLNGLPVINFDGANDFLATGSVPDLDTDKQTWFVVTKANNGTHTGQIIGSGYTAGSSVGADHFWKTTISSTGQYGSFIRNNAGTASQIVSNYNTQYHIISNVWDGNTDIHTMFTDGTLNGTVTGRNASPTGHLRVRLGTNSGTTLTYWYNGRIAEAFVYSKTLNDAERIIVENYLSTKYNIPLTGLDIFAYQNTHSFDAAGIGMTNNKTKTSARGSIVEMSQASSLANGDFLMWAHNNATTISSTADVPTAYSATSGKRMQRTWRAGKTNDVGSTTVTFYLSGIAAGSLSNLELLVDNDGIFTNATRITSGFTYDDGCKVATWTGVNLTDGQYFTIGSPNGTALLRAAAIAETETELEVANNITLFPNPNNGEFSLLVNEVNSNMLLEVYNSVGQIVLQESITQDKTAINIANEANGIYFVKVLDGNKTVTFRKIVKQ